MPFPPEAYLIGAQKAGTTTLAYLLDQHPLVTVSRPKEPHFFTHNRDKGLDWYEKQFPNSSNYVLVDASTSYAMAPLKTYGHDQQREDYRGVPSRVFSANPDAKLIYSLRDPVERTYSGYWHNVRMGNESRNFTTALLHDSFYLDVSDYHGQLSLWLKYFPLTSFFFVLFEDLRKNPEHVAKECWDFLNVDGEAVSVQLDSAKNQSRQVNWAGRKMNRIANSYPAARNALRPVVPRKIWNLLRKVNTGSAPIPVMEKKDREFLLGHFRDKNRDLAALINQPLDEWQH